MKVDKTGVITSVSGKVVRTLDKQPNLTITNFLSKNEVKSTLRIHFYINNKKSLPIIRW